MAEPTRELIAGVAGAGVFGGFHAGKAAATPGVKLARVYDRDLGHASALAERHGADAFDDAGAFMTGLDALIVATPADSHGPLALAALKAGAHVYVEKPLAVTLEEADALLAAAAKARRVLACGHQERVTFRAMGILDAPDRPRAIDSVRRGTPNARNRDVSCVLDLMIHDLDLALLLSWGEPVAVEAQGAFDAVSAEIVFADGLVARFEASRVAESRERTMRLAYASGEVEIDFLKPAFDNRCAVALDAGFATAPGASDPLGASVAAFFAAVRGEGAPVADGAAGARALDLALAVEAAAGL